MKTLSIAGQNLALCLLVALIFPWLTAGWTLLQDDGITPWMTTLGFIAGINALEITGVTLKIRGIQTSLQKQLESSCLTLLSIYGIGLMYIVLSNTPWMMVIYHSLKNPAALSAALGFIILKYLYYTVLLQIPTTPSPHPSLWRNTLADLSLNTFTLLSATFYLALIQSGINPAETFTVEQMAWAALPALFIFGPLEFPQLITTWPTLKTGQEKAFTALSIVLVAVTAAWQMFHV